MLIATEGWDYVTLEIEMRNLSSYSDGIFVGILINVNVLQTAAEI